MFSFLLVLSACSQDNLNLSSGLKGSVMSKTVSNFIEEDGAGNIVNGGYLKANESVYYYANSDDQNKLYQMNKNGDKKIKLSDKVNTTVNLKIQVLENHLFYLQNTLENIDLKCTLYCYDLQKNLEVKLSDKNICSYIIHNNSIYFTTLDTFELFQINLDGTNERQLEQFNYLSFVQIYNNKLYVDFDEALCAINLDGTNMTSKYINTHYNLIIYQNNAYFIGNQKNLYRISLDMEQQESEILKVLDTSIESFNILNNSIYISTTDQKIYRTDLAGGSMEYVANGMNPIIFENSLFFIDSNGKLSCVQI